MVFFICDGCQETLKKASVDRHAASCRSCWSLTCVDCSKSFEGETFRAHVTCMSEAEKYEKTLFRPKTKGGKRDPQAEWTDLIAAAANAPGTSAAHKDLLGRLAGYANVPRKVKPFVNFAKNSLKLHNEAVLTQLFAAIQALAPPRKVAAPAAAAGEAAGEAAEAAGEEAGDKAASKKRMRAEEGSTAAAGGEEAEEAGSSSGAAAAAAAGEAAALASGGEGGFDMSKFITRSLKAGGSLKLKRLRKQAVEAAGRTRGLDKDAAGAAFDAKWGKLEGKGKVALDASGKRAALA
jgi:cell growth-regulating nucleolar protein